MATVKTPVSCRLTVKVENGVTASGAAKTVDRTINNVDPQLPDDDARTIASAYGSLQKYPVSSILKVETSTLEEQ